MTLRQARPYALVALSAGQRSRSPSHGNCSASAGPSGRVVRLATRFDAVITDERMPGLSGSALIREMRGIRDRIPIVLMSGYVGAAVARQAREAGAEEVLKKPLSARDLATSLARVLHS
jgi:CheY-like chemotaxis protein